MGVLKDLTSKFFPGLGDQHVVGLAGVGMTQVNTTLVLSTTQTDVQIVASPPNTAGTVGVPVGVVVHSLGIAPSVVLVQSMNNSMHFDSALVTADNSAVYLRAQSWTGVLPSGAAARITMIR